MTADATYQGLNLLNGTGETLEVEFSNNTASILDIDSVDMTVATSGISAAELNTGGDQINIAKRKGGTAARRDIVEVLGQDAGALLLEIN